ncbi:MAG: DUF362 domain-containing protein [Candidatus Methanomethyliaceae archaeon]|nr:DUF362 domain-containing protein [Candidatus Methanomethyliaceae archaeon]
MKYSVAVVDFKGDVKEAVRRAVKLVDWSCSPSESILIKPNMINSKTSEEGVTTDPTIVSALIEIVKDFGCKVYVGDSPGNAHPGKAREVFSLTGMLKAIEESGAEFLEFEGEPPKVVQTNGVVIRSIGLASCIFKHRIINVPKLKTHMQTLMTGAIKNLVFGCIPGSGKGILHQVGVTPNRMAKAMVDVYSAVRPFVSLNVMDAIVCMDGNGPTGGNPLRVNKILTSKDALALDMISFKMAGIDPFKVPYIREASQRGLGPKSLGEIDLLGDSLEEVKFVLPSTFISRVSSLAGYFTPLVTASPSIIPERCTGCGNCAEACPADAIALDDIAKIDRSKCIKCYVCHEVCEFDAVEVKKGFFEIIDRWIF